MFNLKNIVTQPHKYKLKILNQVSSNLGRIDYVQVLSSAKTIAFESEAARGLRYFKPLKKNDILDLGLLARVFVFDFFNLFMFFWLHRKQVTFYFSCRNIRHIDRF